MKKIVLTVIFMISINWIFASVYLTVNLQNGEPNDYDTIASAIQQINDSEEYYTIEVFPDYDDNDEPIITVFNEVLSIEPCTLVLKSKEGKDYTIIDSNTGLCSGTTAITVQTDDKAPGNGDPFPYKVTIYGFSIIRSGDIAEGEEEDSGIVIFSRNVSISNCSFGSRDDNNPENSQNFFKSIFFSNEANKGEHSITVSNCLFDKSCDLNEEAWAIKCVGIPSGNLSYLAYFFENTITDCGNGIFAQYVKYFKILDNTIVNNQYFDEYETYGLNIGQSPQMFLLHTMIQNNLISRHNYGIYLDYYLNPLDLMYNELKNQEVGIYFNGSYGFANIFYNVIHTHNRQGFAKGVLNHSSISLANNTFINTGDVNGSTAIDCGNFYGGSIFNGKTFNNIFWDYGTNIIYPTGQVLEVNYCCFNGSIAGFEPPPEDDGNVNDLDPEFISDDPDELDFCQLSATSPCIDAGNPDFDGDGFEWDEDPDECNPDGSRQDIGRYAFLHPGDIKHFEPGWNWDSFPSLSALQDNNGDLYQNAVYEDEGYPALLRDEDGNRTITNFLRIEGARPDEYNEPLQSFIDYDVYENPPWIDYRFEDMLFRHEGYKIYIEPGTDNFIFYVGEERLESYYYDLLAGKKYWLCYYVPVHQNIVDAFGDDFDLVKTVKGEDWFYGVPENERDETGLDPKPYSNSPEGKTLVYGKTYIVEMKKDVNSFSWYDSNNPVEEEKKEKPESFTYEEKADYEVIDILEIEGEENILEIGVFEDDVCVGATRVDEFPLQILAYTDELNREGNFVSFQIVTGRGEAVEIPDYTVYNPFKGLFEYRELIAGQQEWSIVRLETGEYEDVTPLHKFRLNQNYPNPFHPLGKDRSSVTNISFSIPSDCNIELSIYNIKGQKIQTLYNGKAGKGEHELSWDGTNKFEKPVSSGIYLYQLSSGEKSIQKKMLLLR